MNISIHENTYGIYSVELMYSFILQKKCVRETERQLEQKICFVQLVHRSADEITFMKK